ncbi:Maf-like protein [Rhizobium sp. L1K21]|uniref:Maf-like protein n=1 Tax=Rhizobium sp. L1K21 TaxID=2954933 RepID=UPI002092E023|nr:Maf-like protein [Rhizobium sp. L1K21]MCO6188004.1 Maf-like protein [Rhizobium sp. L1K21]
MKLILASGSPFRKALLSNAGFTFDAIPAGIDERQVEAPLAAAGSGPQDIALALAEAKARDVSVKNPDALTIGSDQVLSMGRDIFHKCTTMAEARERLLQMSGREHLLDSAFVIVRHNAVLTKHVSRASMTFRTFTEREIDTYLEEAGEGVLGSVGAYQFEGLGIRLFEKIEGDYFTIIGMPMLPLLSALRELGAIDA